MRYTMFGFASLFCSLSGLFCNSLEFVEINSTTFEPYVLKHVHQDGDNVLFTYGIQNIRLEQIDIPVFRVEDVNLGIFLGLSPENPVSIISMKGNLTDFDTYALSSVEIAPSGVLVYDVTTFLSNINNVTITPVLFKQSDKMHSTLQMKMDNDIYKENAPHITLFFSNVDDVTIQMAIRMREVAVKSNMTYSCWDLLQSDPPIQLNYKRIPSVGMTSKSTHGENIVQLRHPINEETIGKFVQANINEYNIKKPNKKV